MTEAYRCDLCGEYSEGHPHGRLKVETSRLAYSSSSTTPTEKVWVGTKKYDLCEDCFEDFKESIEADKESIEAEQRE